MCPFIIVENYDAPAKLESFSSQDATLATFFFYLAAGLRKTTFAGVLMTSYMSPDEAESCVAGSSALVSPRPYVSLYDGWNMGNTFLDVTTLPALQSAVGLSCEEMEHLEIATRSLVHMDPAAKDSQLPMEPCAALSMYRFSRPTQWAPDVLHPDLEPDPARDIKHRLPDVPVYSTKEVINTLAERCSVPPERASK